MTDQHQTPGSPVGPRGRIGRWSLPSTGPVAQASRVRPGVAERLGLAFLDTGAMYRAITWLALQEGVDLDDQAAVRPCIDGHRPRPPSPAIAINGVDVTEAIRAPEVSAAVSAVATNLDIRADLVARQKKLIAEAVDGIVAEGRDITTVVAPTPTYACSWLPTPRASGAAACRTRRASNARGRSDRPGDPTRPRRLHGRRVRIGGSRSARGRLHFPEPGGGDRNDLRIRSGPSTRRQA